VFALSLHIESTDSMKRVETGQDYLQGESQAHIPATIQCTCYTNML